VLSSDFAPIPVFSLSSYFNCEIRMITRLGRHRKVFLYRPGTLCGRDIDDMVDNKDRTQEIVNKAISALAD